MKKNLLLVFIALCFTFIIAEVVLRIVGIKPGIHQYSAWFTPVDTLINKDGFYADSFGIFKTSPRAVHEVPKRITQLIQGQEIKNNTDTEVEEIYGVIFETHENSLGKNESAFIKYATAIKHKPTKDDLDSAIINYAFDSPYNTDGFRSIAFKQYTGRPAKKILLIGDSFTWGHSAWPISNCFADELLSRGYIVYNTGVSGADPSQYLAIAQKYISELKPDYVVTNFFMGNDAMYLNINNQIKYYDREVKPFQPIHYSTNAGNLIASPQGVYLSTADSAYQFVLTYYSIPKNSLANRTCAATAFGTFVWMQLHKRGLVSIDVTKYAWYWDAAEKNYSDTPYCNRQLQQIDSICKLHGSTHFILAIKDIASEKYGTPDRLPNLFKGVKYYNSPVNKEGYNPKDVHYNNQGHKQHADYIEKLIKGQQ